MKNLFGEEIIAPKEYYQIEDIEKWKKCFRKWAEKEYDEKSSLYGRFCCGYEWTCEFCGQEKMEGCQDCVDVIIDILETKTLIDYTDYDFEKWEKLAISLIKE